MNLCGGWVGDRRYWSCGGRFEGQGSLDAERNGSHWQGEWKWTKGSVGLVVLPWSHSFLVPEMTSCGFSAYPSEIISRKHLQVKSSSTITDGICASILGASLAFDQTMLGILVGCSPSEQQIGPIICKGFCRHIICKGSFRWRWAVGSWNPHSWLRKNTGFKVKI